ncbi:MAG: putative glycolipid-binding domain-containing protein [Gaiellaceae bacterium]
MRTHVWRGLDEPRMEIAYVESPECASGTQIGIAYEVRWEYAGTLLRVETVGGAARAIELGSADFFDLGYSAFFNSLPVWRDGLLEAGPARDYRMRFVDVPEPTEGLSSQRYEPLGGRVVRYRSGSFETDIEFDADGFVTLYHGYLERVA